MTKREERKYDKLMKQLKKNRILWEDIVRAAFEYGWEQAYEYHAELSEAKEYHMIGSPKSQESRFRQYVNDCKKGGLV